MLRQGLLWKEGEMVGTGQNVAPYPFSLDQNWIKLPGEVSPADFGHKEVVPNCFN